MLSRSPESRFRRIAGAKMPARIRRAVAINFLIRLPSDSLQRFFFPA
jgi:hypothetical protein